MGETLEALRRLQDVELQLAAIRIKREAKTRRHDSQKRKAKQADERLDAHRRKALEKQKTLDALSLDVASREDSVAKHREALNKAKTNKEYSSILQAMNTEKADTAKLESAILELMEETQRLKAQEADLEANKVAAHEGIEQSRRVLEAFDAECREEREELEARREECSANIAPGTLSSFMRVAERHEGEAMALVRKTHPKRDEFICEGCNLQITLETVNALQSRDEIQVCNSCGRILFLDAAPAGK